MKGNLSTLVVLFLIWLLPGCAQEEEQAPISKEAQLQKSLERINALLEEKERGEGAMLQDVERLREIKAGLEKELGAQGKAE